MPVAVNHLEVLELSLSDIEGKSQRDIEQLVSSQHGSLYAKTVGGYANIPRSDGLSNLEYQNRLNDAKNTLSDAENRRQFLSGLREVRLKKAAEQAAENAEQAAEQAAEHARQAAEQAAKQAAKVAKYIVNVSGIIAALGASLVAIGFALSYFHIPEGNLVTMLGLLVLPFGFTAFLYKGSGRQAVVFGVAGVILFIAGFILERYSIFLGDAPLGPYVRFLGGGVILSEIAALLLKQLLKSSQRTMAVGTLRFLYSKWKILTINWRPMARIGATTVAIGLALWLLGIVFEFLLGIGFIFFVLVPLCLWGGVIMIAIGIFQHVRS